MFKELSLKEKKILYFVIFIIGLLTTMLIGISNVFALTNKTIYSGVNESGLTGSGYYNYGYINEGGVQNTATAKVGNTINGISYGFQFYYYEDIILNNTYTLKINFKDNDLLKSVNSNYFDIQTCNNDNCNNAIIISLEKANQNSNSNWAIIKFNPVSIGNIVSITIGTDDNKPITGIQTFGISSIQTEYSNVNQDIIDNNNNNTNNIIDNNNNNTQNIIDSNKETQEVIKDQFNTCRDSVNLINPYNSYNTSASYTYNDYTYKITSNGSIYLVVSVQSGKTYTLSYENSVNFASIRASDYNNGGTWLEYGRSTSSNGKITFTSNSDTAIIQFVNGTTNQSSVSKVQLELGSVATTFEPYGEEICQNKIDETNDKLDDLNGTLNDSNIDGSLNSGASFFDNFTTTDHGGLSGIITAPLVSINQMLNTSCSPMTATFKGKELSLPCGYDFWNRLGAIQDFINIALGGMLCYRIIIKLYKLIEGLKNPEDDRLEVMDL